MSQPYDVPLFGDPDPAKAKRELSRKEQDDAANKVTWRRYKGQPRSCQDCFEEIQQHKRMTFGKAAFIRSHRGVDRPICYEHKALRDEADAINNRGGQ